MSDTNGLLDAASVLEARAAGRLPDRAQLLAGALALDTLCRAEVVDRDLLDAAADLQMLVNGRGPDLDAAGRARAAHLAEAVRKVASEGTEP